MSVTDIGKQHSQADRRGNAEAETEAEAEVEEEAEADELLRGGLQAEWQLHLYPQQFEAF